MLLTTDPFLLLAPNAFDPLPRGFKGGGTRHPQARAMGSGILNSLGVLAGFAIMGFHFKRVLQDNLKAAREAYKEYAMQVSRQCPRTRQIAGIVVSLRTFISLLNFLVVIVPYPMGGCANHHSKQ